MLGFSCFAVSVPCSHSDRGVRIAQAQHHIPTVTTGRHGHSVSPAFRGTSANIPGTLPRCSKVGYTGWPHDSTGYRHELSRMPYYGSGTALDPLPWQAVSEHRTARRTHLPCQQQIRQAFPRTLSKAGSAVAVSGTQAAETVDPLSFDSTCETTKKETVLDFSQSVRQPFQADTLTRGSQA